MITNIAEPLQVTSLKKKSQFEHCFSGFVYFSSEYDCCNDSIYKSTKVQFCQNALNAQTFTTDHAAPFIEQ